MRLFLEFFDWKKIEAVKEFYYDLKLFHYFKLFISPEMSRIPWNVPNF